MTLKLVFININDIKDFYLAKKLYDFSDNIIVHCMNPLLLLLYKLYFCYYNLTRNILFIQTFIHCENCNFLIVSEINNYQMKAINIFRALD